MNKDQNKFFVGLEYDKIVDSFEHKVVLQKIVNQLSCYLAPTSNVNAEMYFTLLFNLAEYIKIRPLDLKGDPHIFIDLLKTKY